jgi:hypothetical protein
MPTKAPQGLWEGSYTPLIGVREGFFRIIKRDFSEKKYLWFID